MKKNYFLDTNVLLEEESIKILRNGEENNIFVSISTIDELDKLKTKKNMRFLVNKAVNQLWDFKEQIHFIGDRESLFNNKKIKINSVDDIILNDLKDTLQKDKILITNDKILRLKAFIYDEKSEPYKIINPNKVESQKYTGIIDIYKDDLVKNCFFWSEGQLFYNSKGEKKPIPQNKFWNISPYDYYQNALMTLLTDENIDLLTIQGEAGKGKSFISLAAALYLTLEKKYFKKVYIIKPSIEIGEKLGFLPGNVDEKMEYYWRPLYKLLLKLHSIRRCNKVFENPNDYEPDIKKRFIEFLPINYLRGENIDNAVVIISEAQNISRQDMKSVLTRMGKNVKCIIEGDVSQIDNELCNKYNNGLNLVCKHMKDKKNFGHIMLNGKRTRGKICSMVLASGL